MPHPSAGEDWIELTNNTNQAISLANWTISDSTSVIKTLSETLSVSNSLIIQLTNRLNNGGDSIFLKDGQAQVVDQYIYNSDPGIDQILSPHASAPPPPSASPSASPSTSISVAKISQGDSETFMVSVSLQNFPINTKYYLKGAFYKQGSINYFGYTLANSNWVRNLQTFSEQLAITTDQNGSWIGQLELMNDEKDSGFTGSGEYQLKVGRYSSSGSGPTWSDSQNVNITSSPSPPQPTTDTTPTPSTVISANANNSPQKIKTETFIPKKQVSLPQDILGTSSAELDTPTESTPSAVTTSEPPSNTQLYLLPLYATILYTMAIWFGTHYQLIRHSKLPLTWLNKYWPKKLIEQ